MIIKKSMIILATLATIALSGCSSDLRTQTSVQESNEDQVNEQKSNKVQESEHESILTYQEYRKLFNDMGSQLVIPNAKLIEKTDDVNLVAIDKSFSFGTRSVLTLNGDLTNQETQERIVYKDKDSEIITLIDLIYLKSFLGNDMIFWPSHETETFKQEPMLKKYEECIVSYKNILIKVTLISTDKPLEYKKKFDTFNSVISYLQSYN